MANVVDHHRPRAAVDIAKELAEEFAESATARDQARNFPHAEIGRLKNSGLAALFVPTEYGGGGGDYGEFLHVVAALAEGDSSLAQMLIPHTYGVEILNRVDAPSAVKALYYRRLVGGEMWIGNAYSERGTKTIFDFASRVRLEDDEAHWVLNGTKFYCTGSLGADVIYVSALENAPAATGVRDETDLGRVRMCFVAPDAPGVVIHDDWAAMGQRTTGSGTIEFHDVKVPAAHSFGTEGLDSDESLFGVLGQAAFGAVFTGVSRSALRESTAYVRERSRPWPQGDVNRACEDPYVIHRVGEMQILVSLADEMLAQAIRAIAGAVEAPSADARALAAVATSEFKATATEAALQVTEVLFQVCGTGSALERWGFDRFWRDVRTLTLHDPVDYKYRLVGDFELNAARPPVTSFT